MSTHRNIRMDRPDLLGLPDEAPLPAGYRRVACDAETMPRWIELLNAGFPESSPFSAESWREQTTGKPQFRPEWVVLIEREADRLLIATAFAWIDRPEETTLGRVHWVACLKESRGLGLGRWVTLAVLRHLRDAGFARAMLDTQAFRLPAITLYRSLGFAPTPQDAEDEAIWQGVLAQLG